MKSMLITLGLTLALSCSVLAGPQCHTSELTPCIDIAVNWLHSLPKRSIPQTEDDLIYECEELGKAIDCALKYRDSCMTPLQKEALGLLLDGIFDFRDSFCSSGTALRAKYLSHAPCLNKVSQSDAVREQIEYILAVVERLMTQKASNKIMYACCGYRKIHGEFKNMSTDSCGKEATDMAIELITMLFTQLPDVLCNSMDGTEDRCQALLPPAGTKVSNDIKAPALYQFLRNTLRDQNSRWCYGVPPNRLRCHSDQEIPIFSRKKEWESGSLNMVVPRCYRELSLRQTGRQMDSLALKTHIDKNVTFLLHSSYVEKLSFGREPAALVCKNCGQFIVTEISRHNGVCSYFTVLVALFICTPMAWLPLIAPTCKDTLHACPNCGEIIGVHRYFK